MNLANKLTLLRVFMIPIFLVVLYLNPFGEYSRLVAALIFVAASLTDFLDGYIARSRNMVTNFGKLMDPLADKLLVSSALIVMIDLGDLKSWIVIILVSREFIVTGLRMLALEKNLVLAAGSGGKLKTATQMIMIVYILTGINNFTYSPIFAIIGNLLIFTSVLFSVVSIIEYFVKNIPVLKG